MTSHDRVIWDEGMMLSPQHFQQWERWLEAELRDRVQANSTYGWGYTALDIDRGALAGGQLAVSHCSGFFPDGTGFSCPGRDALPPPRAAIDAIDDNNAGLQIYLALPMFVQGSSAYGEATDGNTPLLRQRQRVRDSGRPETDREINTARLNLSLRFEGEDLSAFRTMPIARVVRAAGGGVDIAPDASAPSLSIHSSPLCLSVLRQVAGMLSQKWTELSGKRRGSGGGMADAAGLLLLHTVGEHLPAMRHFLEHGGASTEQAFLQLAKLAAQMCSFHESATPTQIPGYRHEDAGPGLRQLGDMLQEMLGEAAPVMCDTLPLEREGESMFSARIPSPNMLSHGSLFLAVRADAPEEQIQQQFPGLTKISSKDKVQELLMRAISGLAVRHVPQPPAAIPTQTGRTYFQLEPGGEHWDAISQSLTVALHVSPGLPKLELELFAVKN